MREFYYVAAAIVFLTVAVGLVRLLLGPRDVDRMMAAQLLGSGGTAVMLLATGSGITAALDVALTFALLAAFAAVALTRGGGLRRKQEEDL